jgi:hypothetical protein
MHRVLVSPDAPTVSLKLAASLRELLAGPPSVHITINLYYEGVRVGFERTEGINTQPS